ncbi:hypothetical protein TUM4438_45120 [Shewanella sairae]|uniref:Conjugal transfer protein TrbH n=1 Tax=Shewanella sairae TaxID=190310 RepID=A0ABQ4PRP7_9GAMM|nr:hypothetical protein [Shewanella sairae]MCL1132620.1 hypothetical protein [Shewanella sairae]GIU52423.1 hypothetical protein TUM4438_45120 [Shewanella sairae]
MRKLILVFTLILMAGCSTSPRNYFNFSLSDSEETLIASDLAWLIKEKHGAAATFEFDYPMWSTSTSFSEAVETALRKQGLALYVRTISEEEPVAKTHNELYYTLDTLNEGQLYIRVMVNDRFSFQRIWLRDHNEILRPLATTSVFEGVSGE